MTWVKLVRKKKERKEISKPLFTKSLTVSQDGEIVSLMTSSHETQAAEIFKALGHPARIRMIQALAEEEKCVCYLVEVAGLGWSTVSRHLSVLREAGVITCEKRGLQVFYRLALPCVIRFLDCLERPEKALEIYPVSCGCSN